MNQPNSPLVRAVEAAVKRKMLAMSPVHGLGHLTRTALGAVWFAERFGLGTNDQEVAYIAGLVHDLSRPSSEKIDHTEISLGEAEKLLVRVNAQSHVTRQVLQLVGARREFHEVKPLIQCLFLSDKLLEQSGAYIVFRRSYYIGECEDFRNTPFEEAVQAYWKTRMIKFSPEKFSESLRPLAEYQFQWQARFIEEFRASALWALNIAKTFYDMGRVLDPKLEENIVRYNGESVDSQSYVAETREHLTGQKYKAFESMVMK